MICFRAVVSLLIGAILGFAPDVSAGIPASSTAAALPPPAVIQEAFGARTDEWGSALDRHRANTKEEDPTGLLNEGLRYRDIETGTFLSRDPAGFVDGPNLYTYVRQDPWTKFDPHGLWCEDAVIAPISIAAGFASLWGNASEGNVWEATLDGLGIVGDVGLAFVPAAPGAIGLARQAAKVADAVATTAGTVEAAEGAAQAIEEGDGSSMMAIGAEFAMGGKLARKGDARASASDANRGSTRGDRDTPEGDEPSTPEGRSDGGGAGAESGGGGGGSKTGAGDSDPGGGDSASGGGSGDADANAATYYTGVSENGLKH